MIMTVCLSTACVIVKQSRFRSTKILHYCSKCLGW